DEADGDRVEIVEREVAVCDRVERVAELLRGRGQRQRRAGERAGAEWTRLGGRCGWCEADEVALEHLTPREQVVPDRDRLSTLQVRVAGHRRLGVRLGEIEQRSGELADRRPRL